MPYTKARYSVKTMSIGSWKNMMKGWKKYRMLVSLETVVLSSRDVCTYLQNCRIKRFSNADFVVWVLLSRMPSIVASLLAQAFSLFVEEVRNVGLGNDENDDGETKTSEDCENPENPL